ncbi:MAG: hypothetical protein ACRDZN_04315 [Acidimicrobiales bacterium]
MTEHASRPTGLDAATTAAFERDGFVVVQGLDDEELGRFGPAVTEAVARRTASDTRTLAEKTGKPAP